MMVVIPVLLMAVIFNALLFLCTPFLTLFLVLKIILLDANLLVCGTLIMRFTPLNKKSAILKLCSPTLMPPGIPISSVPSIIDTMLFFIRIPFSGLSGKICDG